jgi:hypothetical protein
MPKHGSFALAGVLVAAFMLFDQSSAIHVLQGADGTLYLAQDSDAWTMQPSPISDADLAALTPSGELDGVIPAPFLSTSTLAPVQAVQSADGSLYLVQGSNVWTLLPLAADDGDVAALKVVLGAIQHAGSINRDALFSTSNFDGVLGTWSMTSTGDPTRIQAPLAGSR